MKNLLCILTLLAGTLLFGETPKAIGWGVITTPAAKSYNKDASAAPTLTGGTLFTLLKEISLNKAPAYYIALPKEVTRVIAAEDAKIFLGEELIDAAVLAQVATMGGSIDDLAALLKKQKSLEKYYAAVAQRDLVLQRARSKHLAKSPAKDLTKKRAELAKIPEKDKALAAAEKKAKTNAQRLKYRDERKALRYRATGLMAEIERMESVAADWEKAHPFDPSAAKQSAVYKTLDRQVKQLEAQLELGVRSEE